jgi:diguanylate cyclase (GGDEF)-like protein
MASLTPQSDRAAFAAESRAATRGTGRLVGVIALVAVPAWAAVDRLLEPAHAGFFLQLRVASTLIVLAALIALVWTPLGARRPEPVMFVMLAAVQVSIAVMLAVVDESHATYATGSSLAIYGSAFLLLWSWRWTAGLVALTAVAVAAAALLLADDDVAGRLAAVTFYLGTASALAIAGQWFRHRLAWREFQSRSALEREQERNRELVARLDHLARHDGLTGLLNRLAFDDALEREVERSRRTGSPLALIAMDLDRFKEVNDEHGHLAGDHVLRAVAGRLAERVRIVDVAARLGGDEFAVLCPDTPYDAALVLAADLERLAAHPALPDGTPAATTLSAGVAALADRERGDDLVARADRELYRVKRGRRPAVA